MNVATYIYIIVPIVIVVVILKLCLIFCRAYVYHKRREEQRILASQQQMMAVARAQAARNQVMRITTNGQATTGGHQIVQLHRPLACAGGRVLHTGQSQPPRRTIVLQCDPDSLMALRRSIDPNLPPSYDQAVSGRDRSVKVEDGKGTTGLPPPPEYSADNYDVPSAPVVHENSVHEVERDGDDQPLMP